MTLTTKIGEVQISSEASQTIKKRGRPTNSELQTKKPGGRGKVGRPKGDAAVMNDYRARMLASPKSEKVMAKIFDAALDDDHKHQGLCLKMIADRIMPAAGFEKLLGATGGRPSIEITINGIGSNQPIDITGTTIEGESDAEEA